MRPERALPGVAPLRGAVLCGGASRRMGQDKALVTIEGEAMAVRVARALHEAGASEVVAVGGDEPALAAFGLVVVPDERPGEGPLAAVVTALRAGRGRAARRPPAGGGCLPVGEGSGARPGGKACSRSPAPPEPDATMLVIACDLVHPSPAALAATAAALAAAPGADLAVPVVEGREQWGHAAWRHRALPPLDARLAAGERAVHRAVAAAGLAVVQVPDLPAVALADADTPAELPPGPIARPGPNSSAQASQFRDEAGQGDREG